MENKNKEEKKKIKKINKKTKLKIMILSVVIIVVIISLLILSISAFSKNDEFKKQMDDRVKEIVDNSYLYYLLLNGPLSDGNRSLEINNVKYYYINIPQLKTIEDIENISNSLFVNDIKEYMTSKLFENRVFLEFDEGLYVNSDNVEICDMTVISNLKDYIYERNSDGSYRIFTTFGENDIVYENDNWYLKREIFKCNENLSK